jgi:hypothetical protein
MTKGHDKLKVDRGNNPGVFIFVKVFLSCIIFDSVLLLELLFYNKGVPRDYYFF